MSSKNQADLSDLTYKKGGIFFRRQVVKRKAFFLLMLGLTLGYSGMVALSIFYLGRIIDAFVEPSDLRLFGITLASWAWFFIGFIVTSLLQYGFSLTKDRLQAVLGSGIKQHYLSTRFSHIFRLPFHYLKDKKKGELIGVTEEFASGFDRALGDVLGLVEILVRVLIFMAIIFLTVSYINGLVYLFGLGISFFVSLRIARRYREAVGSRVDEVSLTKGKSYDLVNNYDVVKSFNKEKKEEGVLAKIYQKLRFYELRENAIYLKYEAFNLFTTRIFIFINLGVGLVLLVNGMISVGDLVNLQIFTAFLFGLIVVGAERYVNFTGFLFGVGKSEQIYDLEEEKYSSSELKVPKKFVSDIEFRNVSFSYPDSGGKSDEVLEDVSFSVKEGQWVALTGPSGVGKTTIVNLLLGFYFPTKGDVYVGGVSTKSLDLNFLRGSISVVSQDVSLFNDTIGNNILYGAKDEVSKEYLVACCKQAEIHDFIMGLPNGYDQIVGERGVKLSGGQKQRVGIARAFIRQSKLIVLDEPTSSLDSITEEKIQTSLGNLLKTQTGLIIAHRLSTVETADKILVFKDKKLIGEGTHKQLITSNDVYKNLYELQMSHPVRGA